MAKKKEIKETEDIQFPIEPTPTVSYEGTDKEGMAVKEDITSKVLGFRAKGFDNNRIAALLGIQKSFVDGIK